MNDEIILSDIMKKADDCFYEATKATEKAFTEIFTAAGVTPEYTRKHPDEFEITLESIDQKNGYGNEYKFYRHGLLIGYCRTELFYDAEKDTIRAVTSYQTLKPEESNADDRS